MTKLTIYGCDVLLFSQAIRLWIVAVNLATARVEVATEQSWVVC